MASKNIDGDVNVQFTEASSRQSLETGESVKTLFGKLRKWLSDLKPVAFSGSYNDLSDKPTIPDISGKADKSATVSTVTYDATNKKLTKTINSVTSDIASLSKFKKDMELNNIVTIPEIHYNRLPSQSTSDETYFKEWLAYCVENYREIMLSQKTIVGVCIPNSKGSVMGQCYNYGVDSTTGLPRYCGFVYISLDESVRTFGTRDYVFYFSEAVNTKASQGLTDTQKANARANIGAAPASHTQASSTINAMTGYTKPSSTSAITASDTLNAAIGKLEKGYDNVNATIGNINSVLEEVL